MSKPIIAIPADIREFDGTHWHAAQNQYVRAALKVAGVMSFIIPAFEDGNETDALLDRVDGLLVSGSATNVHPALYGAEARESDGPFDPARDATTLPLIRRAIERGIPLFAICRGIQELNVALGGTLASEIQEQEGVWDHRKPQHEDRDVVYSIRQDVIVAEGSCIARYLGAASIQVAPDQDVFHVRRRHEGLQQGRTHARPAGNARGARDGQCRLDTLGHSDCPANRRAEANGATPKFPELGHELLRLVHRGLATAVIQVGAMDSHHLA
jgi:putative glutamine amidotransferase